MRIVSYTALHYGADYLGWVIRSVIDHVDQHVILYCPHGSHGSRTDRPCPDTRDELYAIAQAAAGDKLLWIDGDWAQENQQRESIYEYAPDADVILVVDADEIWPLAWGSWYGMIELGYQTIRLPIIHFWRSFWRAIIHDPAYPQRLIFPKNRGGDWTASNNRPICHMGYARSPEAVHYKLLIHGHKGQLRDIDWYMRERFLANAQQDCHPVGSEWWQPEPVNPLDFMPQWMSQHPYFGMQVIE